MPQLRLSCMPQLRPGAAKWIQINLKTVQCYKRDRHIDQREPRNTPIKLCWSDFFFFTKTAKVIQWKKAFSISDTEPVGHPTGRNENFNVILPLVHRFTQNRSWTLMEDVKL